MKEELIYLDIEYPNDDGNGWYIKGVDKKYLVDLIATSENLKLYIKEKDSYKFINLNTLLTATISDSPYYAFLEGSKHIAEIIK